MRSRQNSGTPAISFLILAMAATFAGWTGCGAGGSAHISGSGASGTGATATTSSGSVGGAGTGGSATDGGNDAEAGPTCTSSQKVCNDTCVDQGDPTYGCSATFCAACPTYNNAAAACSMGACTIGTCAMGFKNCDNSTTGCNFNVSNDPMNCNACGATCPSNNNTPACTSGVCTIGTCATGFTDCNGMAADGCEANTQQDPNNCGTCGNVCPTNNACQAGVCVPACPKGFCSPASMPNSCNTMTGTNKDCNFCGDICNLSNSTSNCVADPSGNGNDCSLVSCNAGFANCDTVAANGCEVNTNTDSNNCGSCGNQCPFGPNSTAICTNGVCQLSCNTGWSNCGQPPIQGCPVNTGGTPGDVQNCGSCGLVCSSNHATEACNAGACSITVCQSGGWQDCNQKASDGCEANTQTDPNNCGTCGNICKTANGTPACVQGQCAVGSCNAGFMHCPSQTGTNCETATGTDVNNCGTCGNVCNNQNGTATCTGGMCGINCNPAYANCDGSLANGCEVALGTVANCGSCGPSGSCNTLNGTPTCNTATMPFSCAVGSCSVGYANCPGQGTNCLTYIEGSDVNNCGACNKVCPGGGNIQTPVCTGGVCTPVCKAGYITCATACDTDKLTDINNCGGCGTKCTAPTNGTVSCQSGVCVPSCGALTACGASCIDTKGSDNSNCGGCGTTCSAAACGGNVKTASCTAGVCDATVCDAGFVLSAGATCSAMCACTQSTVSNSCPSATSLGPIAQSQTITRVSNLFPAAPASQYYSVTFAVVPTTNTTYHPHIAITDPLNEFLFDVTSDCSTDVSGESGVSCNTGGDVASSAGLTSWDQEYTAGDATSWPVTGDALNPVPRVGSAGTVYIRVYRKGAVTQCNNQYTLTITN